jgi:hypothetical protein
MPAGRSDKGLPAFETTGCSETRVVADFPKTKHPGMQQKDHKPYKRHDAAGKALTKGEFRAIIASTTLFIISPMVK